MFCLGLSPFVLQEHGVNLPSVEYKKKYILILLVFISSKYIFISFSNTEQLFIMFK